MLFSEADKFMKEGGHIVRHKKCVFYLWYRDGEYYCLGTISVGPVLRSSPNAVDFISRCDPRQDEDNWEIADEQYKETIKSWDDVTYLFLQQEFQAMYKNIKKWLPTI